MIAVVRDARGVTHVAMRLPDDADGIRGDTPSSVVIGALCEYTLDNLLGGTFTSWTTNEIEDGLPDCMSCLVVSGRYAVTEVVP
jgi:hypothetical protein